VFLGGFFKSIVKQVVEEIRSIMPMGYRSSHIPIDLATTALRRLHASLLIALPKAKPKTIVAALSASFEPT
jgi:hypothetical protein